MTDEKMDTAIGIILRTGVMLAAAIVLAGGAFYLAQNPNAAPDHARFHGVSAALTHFATIATGAASLNPLFIIQFGLVVLMATPVVRVIACVFGFGLKRDWHYVVISCIVLALLAGSLSAADDAPGKLAARALGPTPIFSDLSELCDGIGGRPTGSDALNRAVDWAARKFVDAGYSNVKLESFTIPHLWLPGAADAAAIAPERFPIRIAAAPFTPSTNGPVELRVVDAGEGSEHEFTALGERARGAAVLVHSSEMKTFDDLFAEYLRNAPLLAAAQKAGAAALLLESTRPRGLLYRHPLTFDGSLAAIPAAIVSREHFMRLARLASQGATVRLDIRNKTAGAYESNNVVADLPGREKPDEIVLVGAHLDSWDLGTGAEDNGVNAALILDIARGFKQLGIVPRRTIRFVLFTGEEQGMWGSRRYVEQHRAELGRHAAVVVFDTGSGRLTGF